MSILIQNKATAFFFKGGKTWEPDFETAFDFESIGNAVQFCARNSLNNVQIMLRSQCGEQEMILPIRQPGQ